MDQFNTDNSANGIAGFDNSREMIRVTGISKIYRLGETPISRLKGALGLGSAGKLAEHHALDNVSFAINKGETVGIIGSNGAGKSTLLQIITGTLTPTSGLVKTNGRISALLELGSGFNPEWTGRRNAEFQCILQGVPSAEIAAKLSAIEEFADIGAYFDQPARTYSSGMFLRVAFASAIATEPEILIVDEALAVGDVRFQNKCFRRFEEMQKAGCTILFVTHSPDLIARFCTRGIVLETGHIIFDGGSKDATQVYMNLSTGALAKGGDANPLIDSMPYAYQDLATSGEPRELADDIAAEEINWVSRLKLRKSHNPEELRSGNGDATILDALLHKGDFREIEGSVSPGERLCVNVHVLASADIVNAEFGLILRSNTNQILSGASNWMISPDSQIFKGGAEIFCAWSFDANVMPGTYFLDLGVADLLSGDRTILDLRQSTLQFQVASESHVFGIIHTNIDFN